MVSDDEEIELRIHAYNGNFDKFIALYDADHYHEFTGYLTNGGDNYQNRTTNSIIVQDNFIK